MLLYIIFEFNAFLFCWKDLLIFLVIYLFDMKLILLLSILIVALAISPEPKPTCSKPAVTLKDLPISPQEMQTFNMN